MTGMRRSVVVLLVLSVVAAGMALVLDVHAAHACSCVSLTDTQAVDAADAVFSGTVRAVSSRTAGSGDRPDSRVYTVAVDEGLKGDVAVRQRVRTTADSASCGVTLERGAEVLVFATAGSGLVPTRPGELATSLCSGTRALDAPVPDEVRAAARGAPVDCAAAIDAIAALPAEYAEIAGVVALPRHPTLQLETTGTPPHFAKVGLAVRAGATASISVRQDRRSAVAVQWGSRPASIVRVEGCAAPGGEPWLAFAGGFWVDRPLCGRFNPS